MNSWISAAIAVVAGVVIGSIVSKIVGAKLAQAKIEAIRGSAAPLAGLVFSGCVIIGLLVALGFVSPDELSQIQSDAIAFLPKAITGAILVIAGNIAGTFVYAAVARATAGAGPAAKFAPMLVKTSIVAMAAIVAATTMGINTTVINIAVAALVFGVAASIALLTGLGGRRIAGEVAAGRVWRRSLESGDVIRAHNVAGIDVAGTVVEIHPTAIEVGVVDDEGPSTLFVPNTLLMDVVVERNRPPETDVGGELRRR